MKLRGQLFNNTLFRINWIKDIQITDCQDDAMYNHFVYFVIFNYFDQFSLPISSFEVIYLHSLQSMPCNITNKLKRALWNNSSLVNKSIILETLVRSYDLQHKFQIFKKAGCKILWPISLNWVASKKLELFYSKSAFGHSWNLQYFQK